MHNLVHPLSPPCALANSQRGARGEYSEPSSLFRGAHALFANQSRPIQVPGLNHRVA